MYVYVYIYILVAIYFYLFVFSTIVDSTILYYDHPTLTLQGVAFCELQTPGISGVALAVGLARHLHRF